MDFRFDAAIEILSATPATFRSLLEGLSDEWLRSDEGPGTFTPYDNLAHLVHAERTNWIPRARVILEQGADRRFPPFDRFGHYHEGARAVSLLSGEFEALRAASLDTLRGWRLTERELALEGEHPSFGRVTLRQLLSTWVVHDLGHLAQTARVLAKQYREAVGPWREYLPILDR